MITTLSFKKGFFYTASSLFDDEVDNKIIKGEIYSIDNTLKYKNLNDLFQNDSEFKDFEILEQTPHLKRKLAKLAALIDAE